MRQLAHLLLCGYLLWNMQQAAGRYMFQKIASQEMPPEACAAMAEERGMVTTKTPHVLAWYAAATKRADGVKVPSGQPEWYGCWPSDFDPRDQ